MTTAALPKQPRPSKLRILCFGDSLTAGYCSMGAMFHPYHERLEQMLAMAFPDIAFETVEDGVPGDTVRFGFMGRMYHHFPQKNAKILQNQADTNGYDWTIVLGGTNDIAMGVPPEEIYNTLKEVWDYALVNNSKVLALTVPEAALDPSALRERLAARRNKLNDLIRSHKADNFHVFDLHAALPYLSMTPSDRQRYWDDTVHFTPAGYDLIGNKVGMALVKLLEAEGLGTPPRLPKRRRMFKDDDLEFEEENGDETEISKGYVVVRRADLD